MGWSGTGRTNKEGGEKKWTALERDEEKDGIPDPSVSISISLKESSQLERSSAEMDLFLFGVGWMGWKQRA
jgi:hypothetical protein